MITEWHDERCPDCHEMTEREWQVQDLAPRAAVPAGWRVVDHAPRGVLRVARKTRWRSVCACAAP